MHYEALLRVNCAPWHSEDFMQEVAKEIALTYSDQCAVYWRYLPPIKPETGGGIPNEIVIAFLAGGTLSGAISGLFHILTKFLARDDARELTLEKGEKKLTMKGHSLPEERVFVAELFPEFGEKAE
jgi:hypothetical protein